MGTQMRRNDSRPCRYLFPRHFPDKNTIRLRRINSCGNGLWRNSGLKSRASLALTFIVVWIHSRSWTSFAGTRSCRGRIMLSQLLRRLIVFHLQLNNGRRPLVSNGRRPLMSNGTRRLRRQRLNRDTRRLRLDTHRLHHPRPSNATHHHSLRTQPPPAHVSVPRNHSNSRTAIVTR